MFIVSFLKNPILPSALEMTKEGLPVRFIPLRLQAFHCRNGHITGLDAFAFQ
ncbi:hypothetical protein [Pseudomonas sp.]|uniref:hypothetical protein n=1 Tax=Pseudomonas sp. TaxID=306 RepID=UPI003D0C7E9A